MMSCGSKRLETEIKQKHFRLLLHSISHHSRLHLVIVACLTAFQGRDVLECLGKRREKNLHLKLLTSKVRRWKSSSYQPKASQIQAQSERRWTISCMNGTTQNDLNFYTFSLRLFFFFGASTTQPAKHTMQKIVVFQSLNLSSILRFYPDLRMNQFAKFSLQRLSNRSH